VPQIDRIVGFLLWRDLDTAAAERADRALQRALAHFPWLVTLREAVGDTTVLAWGHGDLAHRTARPGGGGLVLVAGETVPEAHDLATVAAAGGPAPWEGRHVLVTVSGDGREWTLANDWSGALPAFHGTRGDARAVGTVEPVVAAALGLGAADISRTDAVSLLSHGFFLGRRTLYRELSVLPPDVRVEWGEGGPQETPLRSLAVTAPRAEAGWDELAEEMADRTDAALRGALAPSESWSLALSGGLDSRLIAAVGVAAGHDVLAYTYGEEGWSDLGYARAVSRMLGIPWRHVALEPGYLSGRLDAWLDVFGASLHVHGQYQFPLLEAAGRDRPLAMGFTGDPMGGAQTAAMAAGDRPLRRRFTDKWRMWDDDALRAVLRFDPADAFAELDAELETQWAALDGAFHQRLWQLFQANHVARFSTYQPAMFDWSTTTSAPFVDRALAAFALSLPRAVLDDRRLQVDAFRRRFPALATVPGTWSSQPAAPSGRFYALKTLADLTPPALHRGPLRQFGAPVNRADQRAPAAEGEAALRPIPAARQALDEWIDIAAVDAAVIAAKSGDLAAMARVQAVQALAYALTR
jgi:hypothetical protein